MHGDWTVPGYRHVRPLGEGASGKVMLAVQEATNAPVAIKYLSEQLRTDELFLSRFRAEARLMADLNDPHIVRFYEYVETPQVAALVMELVEGVTLKDILRSEGATGPEAALLVLKGSLLGLAAAHTAGVVHRDYKPGNVLVGDEGRSKLADFGVAVLAGEEVSASGTPAYMAPEQWTTGSVSAATDVYAATAVFYECLTGRRPYPVKGLWALAAAHRADPIPADHVPPPLRGLVAHGMAKDPLDRPGSADVFLTELEEVALATYGPGWEERGRVRLAALAALLAALFPLAGSPPVAGTALALTRLGRRRLGMVSGALVAAVVTGGGGAVVLAGVHHGIGAHSSATSSPAAAVEPSPPPPDSPSSSPSPSPPETTPPPTTAPPTSTPATDPAPPGPIPQPIIPIIPPTKVTAVVVKVPFELSGPAATAQVTVTVSGPGRVIVSAAFSVPAGTAPQVRSATATSDAPQTVRGSGTHTLTFTHTFAPECPAAAHVIVTTSPAGSGSGDAPRNTGECPKPTSAPTPPRSTK
ncbi:MAG: serine/threonine protein kinaselike protein [Actinoallomurus sp.]|nr:serine/threonine protein kinaselike protein [Actinoallomurus sp.]